MPLGHCGSYRRAMTIIRHRRHVRAAATISLLGLAVVGCGPLSDAASAPGTTSRGPVDALTVEVSGGPTGKSTELAEPVTCRWYQWGTRGHHYTFNGAVRINGQPYRLSIGLSSVEEGRTRFMITSMSTGVVTFYRDSAGVVSDERWASGPVTNASQVKGTITLDADKSGSIDAVLSRQKGTPGTPLTIRASWSCATILGAP